MLIDRYILARFFTNFVILFMLLFLFAVAIDLVMSLEHFIKGARAEVESAGGGGPVAMSLAFLKLVAGYQGPRLFQFYAYLHGLVSIGAMGFTLAQLHRHRELVAMLAAGISLNRVAMPFIVAVFGISVIQLVNQEVFLPRVAPLLLRDHGQMREQSLATFPVALTPDGAGNLIQARAFNPTSELLLEPTILDRDERGRTRRRITAASGRWGMRGTGDDARDGWELTGGRVVALADPAAPDATVQRERPIDFFPTDLGPRLIMVQHFGQFAAMLSLRQIGQMLESTRDAERSALLRHRYSRFSTVLVNVLVMWLALPSFLLRHPANLLLRAVMCAALSVPTLLGAAVVMVMRLGDIPPAVSVFLPALVLVPIVMAQWTTIKT